MSKRQQMFVTIVNPHEGGSTYTSYDRALNFVERGLAEWCAHLTIRFVERAVVAKNPRSDDWMGKPRVSLSTVTALRNVPIVNPMRYLTNPTRRKVVGAGAN